MEINMQKKNTDELLNILKNSKSPKEYINHNYNSLITEQLSNHLTTLLYQKNLTKSQVIKNAELNDIYCYQIFSGKRTPSRDTLICICIGMQLTTDETQELLKFAGFAQLYAKNIRDSIILFGINNQQSVYEINEALYLNGKRTLGQTK
jgi:predicted transcriptional regulator